MMQSKRNDSGVVSALGLIDEIGTEYLAIAASGYDTPSVGHHAYHDDFRNGDKLPFSGPTVRFLWVPNTEWGDYLGTTYTRSNYRVLVAEHAAHLITVGNDRAGNGLVIRLDSQIPKDLYDSIVYLVDNCVLSDDDLCEVERKLESECWDNSGRRWFSDNIRRLAWDESLDRDEADTVDELDDHDYVDELFAWLRQGPHGELLEFSAQWATDGAWQNLEEAATHAWAEIKRRRTQASMPV